MEFSKNELESILDAMTWWLDGESPRYSEKLVFKIRAMIDDNKGDKNEKEFCNNVIACM